MPGSDLLDSSRNVTWAYQRDMIAALSMGRYKISKAYMMQCYSAYIGNDGSGNKIDYGDEWRKVAVHFYGYRGVNFMMIDFGKRGKRRGRKGKRR